MTITRRNTTLFSMENVLQKFLNFDLKAFLSSLKKKVNTPFFLSFITSFLALNLIFLYHGSHFMIGDHDWKYLKPGIPLNAGLFEARFSQFIPIHLFTTGKILPILNNLFGFLGFSLGISLLAKYLKLPTTKRHYIIFSLFTTITPFILSFMYFAFLVIPCLGWNFIILLGLYISSKEQTFSLQKTIFSALFFTLALGGYPPVINLFLTAFVARLFIDYHFENSSLKNLYRNYKFTVLNFIIGAIFYKLIIILLTHLGHINSAYYNLQTISPAQYLPKLKLITIDLFKQFFITLPFFTLRYKLTTFFITLIAILSLLLPNKLSKKTLSQKLISTLMFIAIFYSALATLFLSTSQEQTEFSPRIDFFGLMYVYSIMLSLALRSKSTFIKNLATLFALFSIIQSANTLFEAQKVWKLGFDAELKTYKRIMKSYESSPNFTPYKRYIIVQAGSPSLRHRFYHSPYTIKSEDLLDISYVPGMNASVTTNYYKSPEYGDPTAYVYTFAPDPKALNFLKQARPWPHPNSYSVGNYWIMIIYDQQSLHLLKNRYLPQ